MEFPIRCFTCGAIIGDLYEQYKNSLKAKSTAEETLNSMGIDRYCCRRMFISHVDLMQGISKYSRI